MPFWIDGDGRPPVIDWADDDRPISHADGKRINLATASGFRVWVRRLDDATRVVLQFHHACCDGLAAVRVLEDILVAYHELVAGRDPLVALKPLEPQRLCTRGEYGADGAAKPTLRDLWVGACGWTKLLVQSPAPLAAPAQVPEAPSTPLLGFVTHAWDAATMSRLRAAATSLGGTLNDLLLRDMFLVLRQWNSRHGGPRNPWLRINVPATLRVREDVLAPAANALGFTFVTRRARACDNADQLFESIRRETEAIRKYRLGLYFVGGLAMASHVPGLIPWALGRKRSFATVVLSNLGKVLRHANLPRRDGCLVCGDAVLRRVTGVPPIRPLTRAAVAVLNYGGETTVNLRCDPRHFTVAQAEEFLAEYIGQLDRTTKSL